jgi:hypothetical protein
MRQSWIRWALLLAALGAEPCLAQQSALEPPELGRYLRWGPLRVRPRFEVKNLGHDDNIFSSTTNEVDDLTATLAPRLDGLVLFGHRAFLTFDEQLEYTAYRDHSDQNFTNQRFVARATFPLRGKGFFVDGLLNRLKERPIDAEDIRADRDEDGFGVGVILQPGWRTEIEIGRSRKSLSYFDEDAAPGAPTTISDRLDRSEDRHDVELRYRILGRTRLTLHGQVGTIDFDNAAAAGSDSRDWGVLPGLDFGLGGPLSGSLSIGWQEIDADDPTQPDFEDVVGRAEIAYRPGSRTTLRLEGLREPGFTVSSTSIFFLNSRIGLRALYYVNRIIGIETGGSRGKLEFPGPSGGFEREDRTDSYEVGLRFRLAENSLGRRVEYRLRWQHYRTDSNDDLLDRTRTTVGLGAVLGF